MIDSLRQWLEREGKKWNVAGTRARVYELDSGTLVYLLKSKSIKFWGLNPNVVNQLKRSGSPWTVVLVSVDESESFVVDGKSSTLSTLKPNRRGYYLLHKNTELRNVE